MKTNGSPTDRKVSRYTETGGKSSPVCVDASQGRVQILTLPAARKGEPLGKKKRESYGNTFYSGGDLKSPLSWSDIGVPNGLVDSYVALAAPPHDYGFGDKFRGGPACGQAIYDAEKNHLLKAGYRLFTKEYVGDDTEKNLVKTVDLLKNYVDVMISVVADDAGSATGTFDIAIALDAVH